MKVILLQDIPGTGKKNQIVNVSDGYARNFLFPRKWAMEATPNAVREVERRNELQRAKEAARLQEAEELAAQLRD
ncbi:MAG TPA: 50S ribosomal protein L9, partial [Clostridia bacterium]|nr:50S ribosomal protein L9 [Clostridia bacterium]